MSTTLPARRATAAETRDRLLREYARTGDPHVRRELVELHLPLVRGLAARYARRGEPMDDLVQVGSLGLLKALDRFDPSRGVPFEGFATPTITGEIRRHFRDHCWSISVPRSLQELSARVISERERLSTELGRAPTVNELVEATGAPLEQVLDCLRAREAYRPPSIDGPAGGPQGDGATTVGETLGGDDEGLRRADRRITLDEALAHLSPRDRKVVYLRFYEDLTQREIAEQVGVSQMQISRILRASMDRLRDALGE